MSRTIAWRVIADRRQRLYRARLRGWATAGLAASVLLIALSAYVGLPFPRPSAPAPGPVVHNNPPRPVEEAALPPLRRSVDEARLAVASLTDRFAETRQHTEKLFATALPISLTDVVSLPSMHELEAPLHPATTALRETGHGISEGLQPVARSARQAVSYLMRELAFVDKQATTN